MFDIGWGELLVIGVVALIVIGPKELPGVLRTLGQGMAKVRRMASEFQGQFNEAMREAEMADIKKSVDEMTSAARGIQYYDPLNPDGLEPKPETKVADPNEPVITPAPEEQALLPTPENATPSALPDADLGNLEPPKPGAERTS